MNWWTRKKNLEKIEPSNWFDGGKYCIQINNLVNFGKLSNFAAFFFFFGMNCSLETIQITVHFKKSWQKKFSHFFPYRGGVKKMIIHPNSKSWPILQWLDKDHNWRKVVCPPNIHISSQHSHEEYELNSLYWQHQQRNREWKRFREDQSIDVHCLCLEK